MRSFVQLNKSQVVFSGTKPENKDLQNRCAHADQFLMIQQKFVHAATITLQTDNS